LMTVFNTI